MSKPSLKVEGAKDLQRALRKVEEGTSDLKAIHAAAAGIVETAAKPLARRKSGAMADSIRSTGQARQGVVRAGFARVPYAGVQHFGWAARNITPNPFLYDALDDRRGEVLEQYSDQVQSLLKKNNLT